MDEIIALLEAVISGVISLDLFVGEYIALWREIRDEQDASAEALGQNDVRVKLSQDVYSGLITKEKFGEEWGQLDKMIVKVRIRPGTRESQIISHLMVEADAYEPDPQLRAVYQIGETELLVEVSKALQELKTIHSKK